MPNILPVSDLRNYNEVLKNCQVGEPVFLTQNGRGKFVVMDIEDYEREKAEKKLLMKIQEAEEAVRDESAWMSLYELKKSVEFRRHCITIMLPRMERHWLILILQDRVILSTRQDSALTLTALMIHLRIQLKESGLMTTVTNMDSA